MEGFKVLFVTLLFTIVWGFTASMQDAVFKKCGGSSEVEKVLVDKFDGRLTVLTKGATANLTIVFKSNENSASAKSVCHGVIGGVSVPFPVQSNGCSTMKPVCPLKIGRTYTYTTSISVKKLYPSITLLVKWEEVDANGKDIFCILLPAKIQ